MAGATPDNEKKRGKVEAVRSGRELEGGGGEGTLVLHVRSGDIFDDKVLPDYGQVRAYCDNRFLIVGIVTIYVPR